MRRISSLLQICRRLTQWFPMSYVGYLKHQRTLCTFSINGALVSDRCFHLKKMARLLTGKRDDSPLHSAIRVGDLEAVLEILSNSSNEELKSMMSKVNQLGETVLYVAAECSNVDLVKELIKYCDSGSASVKARNGLDAFHIASKQGNLQIMKVLTDFNPDLALTTDLSNTTSLHSAAAQGHTDAVKFLLENSNGLVTIARRNSKTALHSAARNGHVDVVKSLLREEFGMIARKDRKGQTALHMAVKGESVDVVNELIEYGPSLINMIDNQGNTALHIATRKNRIQIVNKLLNWEELNKQAINKSGETALDTAEKNGRSDIKTILHNHGVQSAKFMKPPQTSTSRELKHTVSAIKHEVYNQLEHTRQTRKSVQVIVRRLNKMQLEGLNNAINSTTVVAVLIATVTFAAIFTIPGQNADNADGIPHGFSTGEANIAPQAHFLIFFIADSIALFISLAVVVVQTSIVATEKKAKKQIMTIINKLMWLACVMVSVAFISISYIIVGVRERWLAVSVTSIGTVIMVTTLGTLCYWVVAHRIDMSKSKSLRRSSTPSRSRSRSISVTSDSDILKEYRKLYAI